MPVAHDDLNAQWWNTKFGANPFEDSPPDYTQQTDDSDEYVPIQVPKISHTPSPKVSENWGGVQWSRALNVKKKIKMKSHKKLMMMREKIPKKHQEKVYQKYKPKTPENSENNPLREEPIKTRSEKYNLRPNPNPNYSDSYR